ncbi:hypothetical protein HDU96_008255 [Phlyctochytrium bullatum]|nr:hypothetical protein HDU96_008255 [Phlyctochytrium bullatum]
MLATTAAFLILALATSTVHAHASFFPAVATPGGYLVTGARVPHGCEGNPTLNVTILIPDSVTSVKPRAVPGWNMTIAYRTLDKPLTGEQGPITTAVSNVTWFNGNLSDAMLEEFQLNLRLPKLADGSKVYIPVLQFCANNTENRWEQVPQAGSNASLAYPAPAITLNANNTLLRADQLFAAAGIDLSALRAIAGVSLPTTTGAVASATQAAATQTVTTKNAAGRGFGGAVPAVAIAAVAAVMSLL